LIILLAGHLEVSRHVLLLPFTDDAESALSLTKLFNLNGQVAVVTGGLGKLGPVWIEALLEAGAAVAALDLPDAKPSPKFKELAERLGPRRLHLIRANVTDRASLQAALDVCHRELGEPSILVNNAGIDQPPSAGKTRWRLDEIPADVCRLILDVNVLGVFLTTQVFSRPMVKARRGSIINIGSLYAGVSPDPRYYDHLPGEPAFLKPPMYGVSKAGVVNLGRYLATHLAGFGVRVNTLSPGGVLGGQDEEFKRKFCARVPLGRMAADADLKGPLLFLASDASAYVTGQELLVDGGYTAW
jgi:NAD(P)-dependent dehydrogenase (short-subunit alcohol dehydrogenase family)